MWGKKDINATRRGNKPPNQVFKYQGRIEFLVHILMGSGRYLNRRPSTTPSPPTHMPLKRYLRHPHTFQNEADETNLFEMQITLSYA